jgi:uncharacterized membrane protein
MASVFQWIEQSWLGTSVNNSLWAFAAFEAVHLLALAVIGGAILVVGLRMLGWVFPRQRVAEVATEARPWMIGSIVAMFLTGIPLMASLALSKYYFNEAFRLKMYFLAAALLFTFFVRQPVALGDDARANSRMAKAVAIMSVLLWSGVGIMGRGIGFY